VFGDDEMYLVVNRQNQAFVRSDPLSRDVVRIFAEAYAVHPHLLCLESLRHQRTEIVERLARAAREQRSHRHGYQVKLNGVVQPNM
jgi:hypothetical protein